MFIVFLGKLLENKFYNVIENMFGKLKEIFYFIMFFLLKMNKFGRFIRFYLYIINGIFFKNINFDKK